MDRISPLSDDVIIKILSFVGTKVAVSTNLLSKRWRYLWKHVPTLKYRDPSSDCEHWRASRFVDKFLLLHKAPVLEYLNLKLSWNCPPVDIETWIDIAISRGVRELQMIRHYPPSGTIPFPVSGPITLPRIMYTCETLVTLHLKVGKIIVNDIPSAICFRSLKVLVLCFVKFSSNVLVDRILSGCPVLEELSVVRVSNDKVKTFTIAVPSLKKLIAIESGYQDPGDDVQFVIKAPRLKSLFIYSRCSGLRSLVKMPDLVKADIKLRLGDSNNIMGCLTSTKRLFLCLRPPMDSCSLGVFNHLVSLTLCTCSLDWCCLILNHTPKLRALGFRIKQRARLHAKIKPPQKCCRSSQDVQTQYWEQPSSVPQCLISSLETVAWIDYKGTSVEKKVVMYLLKNSGKLKKLAIRSLKWTSDKEKFKMLQELSSTRRSSTKCQLTFT
ncbi:hypothetical protein CARUB_v10027810mg [Capsella rubella]|uniref:FBD domain-containing protein n=1 Tax=Capsella rubella TaxID=81985 RepID=R0GD18_9BRAS|nr:putative FBD-associated F-box protein At5g56440 [Capsella rubella]EOA14569.1 hypothetical protein CARUB_v10027810mg [Capsella rubella]